MVSQELLEILRCPHCVQQDRGLLEFFQSAWLICQDCGRKYPVTDNIPVMLLDVGERWQLIDKAELPIPPTQEHAKA